MANPCYEGRIRPSTPPIYGWYSFIGLLVFAYSKDEKAERLSIMSEYRKVAALPEFAYYTLVVFRFIIFLVCFWRGGRAL